MDRRFFRFLVTAACVLFLCAALPTSARAATTVEVSTWSQLYDALNSSSYSGSVEIKLKSAVTYGQGGGDNASKALIVTGRSRDITLNLNGCTINGTGARESVIAILDGATLTLKGTGTITGGDGEHGGGVCVDGGKFIMNGGTISNNEASSGGGVYVSKESKNSSGSFRSTFIMNGGEIKNNTATRDGGGVYLDYGDFTLSGSCAFSGNKAGSASSDIYVKDSGSHITIGTKDWKSKGAIGVACDAGSGFIFTSGWNGDSDFASYFKSDMSGLSIAPSSYSSNFELKFDANPSNLVRFHANGGRGSMSDQTFKTNETRSLNPNAFTRSGYEFSGWDTNSAGNTVSYADKANFTAPATPGAITHLYAVWEPLTYTINFHPGKYNGNSVSGGSTASITNFKYTDTTTTLPDNGFTVPQNAAFLGWALSEGASTPDYHKGDLANTVSAPAPPSTTIDLHAIWHTNECTVDFVLNYSTTDNPPTQQKCKINNNDKAKEPAPAPTRAGYTFGGWYTDQTTTTKWDFRTLVTSDLTLYAKWTPIEYTINFYDADAYAANNSVSPLAAKAKVQYDSAFTAPVLSSTLKPGHSISKWYTDPSCTTKWDFSKKVNDLAATPPQPETLSLYGKWEANDYTITFDAGSGKFANRFDASGNPLKKVEITSAFDSPITAPADPEWDGHTFIKWNRDIPATMPAANLTISAVWGYKVAFDSNGADGGDPPTQKVANGGYATRPPIAPQKTGYAFQEWQKEDGTAYKFSTPVTADITLHAKWVEQYWIVEFDVNGGSNKVNTQKVQDGTQIQKITNMPTKDGFSFGGWVTKADPAVPVDYSTRIVKNLVTKDPDTVELIAVWNPASDPAPAPAPSVPYIAPAPAPSVTVPVSGDSSTVRANASLSGSTATVSNVSNDMLDRVIGKDVKTGDVTIDVTGLSKNIETAKLPVQNVKTIAAASADVGNDVTGLSVKLTDASVNFDPAALDAVITASGESDLQLHVSDGSVLNTAQQSAIADRDAVKTLEAYVTADGVQVSDFGGGNATVSVPLAVPSGRDASDYTVYGIGKSGALEQVPAYCEGGVLKFSMSQHSDYVVLYEDPVCRQDVSCPISRFYDAVPTTWYHDGVHYALDEGLMVGYSAHTFAPQDTTTRATIVTILWRLAGQPKVNYQMSFTDVPAGSWYEDAVRWAASAGVVAGYTRRTFAPNDPITREQLTTMLYNYAKTQNNSVAWSYPPNFPDLNQVSSWAYTPMVWATASGIITGTANQSRTAKLTPQGTATRAQAATMLMRFCELNN